MSRIQVRGYVRAMYVRNPSGLRPGVSISPFTQHPRPPQYEPVRYVSDKNAFPGVNKINQPTQVKMPTGEEAMFLFDESKDQIDYILEPQRLNEALSSLGEYMVQKRLPFPSTLELIEDVKAMDENSVLPDVMAPLKDAINSAANLMAFPKLASALKTRVVKRVDMVIAANEEQNAMNIEDLESLKDVEEWGAAAEPPEGQPVHSVEDKYSAENISFVLGAMVDTRFRQWYEHTAEALSEAVRALVQTRDPHRTDQEYEEVVQFFKLTLKDRYRRDWCLLAQFRTTEPSAELDKIRA